MKHLIALLVVVTSLSFGTTLLPVHASAVDVLSPVCNGAASGSAACNTNDRSAKCGINGAKSCNPLFGANGVITIVIRVLGLIIGFIAVVMIIASGLKMILAGGDAASLKEARATLGHALGALLVALLAEAIVGFILSKIP